MSDPVFGDLGYRSTDPRVLFQSNRYRVIAPAAKRNDGRLYVNGSIIIETCTTDSLGVKTWIRVEGDLTGYAGIAGYSVGLLGSILCSLAGATDRGDVR